MTKPKQQDEQSAVSRQAVAQQYEASRTMALAEQIMREDYGILRALAEK